MRGDVTGAFLKLEKENELLILAPNEDVIKGVYSQAVIHYYYVEFKDELWLDVPITATVEGCEEGIVSFKTKAVTQEFILGEPTLAVEAPNIGSD